MAYDYYDTIGDPVAPMDLGLKIQSSFWKELRLTMSDAPFMQVPLALIPLGENSSSLVSVTGQALAKPPLQPLDFVVKNVERIQDHDLRNHVVMTFEQNPTWNAYLEGLGVLSEDYEAHAILADDLSGSQRVRHYIANLGTILHGRTVTFDNMLILSGRKLYVYPNLR